MMTSLSEDFSSIEKWHPAINSIKNFLQMTIKLINFNSFHQAMATQLAANANNVGLNLSSPSNGHSSHSQPQAESSDAPQIADMSMVQQRFMMMMFLYNQFLAAQAQSSS